MVLNITLTQKRQMPTEKLMIKLFSCMCSPDILCNVEEVHAAHVVETEHWKD